MRMRVVYGRPDLWDLYTAAAKHPFKIDRATWSPCNSFIAVTGSYSCVAVDILDSVTLQKLQSLRFSGGFTLVGRLIFSPDSRMLTSCGDYGGEVFVISWDRQTGCIVGVIRWYVGGWQDAYITQSTDGKTVAVLHTDFHRLGCSICICEITSSKRTHHIDLPGNSLPCGFWTDGESLRFAITNWRAAESTGAESITIWEVGFALGATVTKVKTLPTPEPVKFPVYFPLSFTHPQSLPIPRLPMVFCGDVNFLVLDAQASKILLSLPNSNRAWRITCSSGGRFFACSVPGSGVHLWKDSPTGYELRGRLPSSSLSSTPLLSPDGESIVVISDSMVRLWPTKNFPNTPSDTVVEAGKIDGFSLEFLPNRSLAAFSRRGDDTVTVLDFRSGAPQLTINAGMKVRGLGVMEDSIVAIGDKGATTWKLPGGRLLSEATMNVADSTQSIEFYPNYNEHLKVEAGFLSPDSRYIIVKEKAGEHLIIRATDGELIYGATLMENTLRPIPDGRTVGCSKEDQYDAADALMGVPVDPKRGNHGCPWKSPDYEVLDDGWVQGPSKERLLILPPLWRSHRGQRAWNGRFLTLLHGALPEPVILEFP